MATPQRLQGKVAIITGGASGIGAATARLFVENGASVVIADIQDDLGEALARELGGAAIYKRCDVAEEDEVEELVAFTLGRWQRLDIMFSNAGMIGKGEAVREVHELDMGNFDATMRVNARGMALALKHASKAMMGAGTRGSIVCTASSAAIRGGATPAEYTASKHAVIGLALSAAAELGKHGIRVNCVSPGLLATPIALRFFGELFRNPASPEKEIERYDDAMNVLRGHTLRPIDIARAALFLASDDAAFVTGHNLVVDGGITATIKTLHQPPPPSTTTTNST